MPACLSAGCVSLCVCVCECAVHKKQTNKNVISLTNKIDFYCIPLATYDIRHCHGLSSACFLARIRFICRTRFAFPFASYYSFMSPRPSPLSIDTTYMSLSVTLHLSIAARVDSLSFSHVIIIIMHIRFISTRDA